MKRETPGVKPMATPPPETAASGSAGEDAVGNRAVSGCRPEHPYSCGSRGGCRTLRSTDRPKTENPPRVFLGSASTPDVHPGEGWGALTRASQKGLINGEAEASVQILGPGRSEWNGISRGRNWRRLQRESPLSLRVLPPGEVRGIDPVPSPSCQDWRSSEHNTMNRNRYRQNVRHEVRAQNPLASRRCEFESRPRHHIQ